MEKFKKIYHWETTEEHRPIDIENSWPEIWWVEEICWYDGIAYYEDKNTWQRYSRAGYPIADDEMCRYWDVCKVEKVQDWPEEYNYHWKILSRRPDTNEWRRNS